MAKSELELEILGTTFRIHSDESLEYITQVADYLKTRIEEAKTRLPFGDPLKISLLVSLKVIDELFKERQSMRNDALPQSEHDEIERVTELIIHRIDENLTD